MYVATPRSTRLEGDYIKKEYVTISLTVVGVIEDIRFMIAHDAYWPILFFKDVVKMDPFSLVPTGLISTDNQLIKNFSQHQDFIVSYPFATFFRHDRADNYPNDEFNLYYRVLFIINGLYCRLSSATNTN